jgi:ABC-type transport system involved in cytochrome c biogenesis permease subunit
MDRTLLVLSTFCFLFGFASTMHALGARVYRHSRLNLVAMLCGFVLQTAFLYVRGQALGRCPLTNLFEVLIFLSWSMVLFYLLIGPTYRLSLLGFFTSPLVFILQVFALLTPWDVPGSIRVQPNAWLELHAAVSIVAYGAFALAGVAGVMYLAQERQLKTHHLKSIFFHLPPICDLATANRRLVFAGLLLLSVGLVAGFAMGNLDRHAGKIAWSSGVWLLYAFLAGAEAWRRISPRRAAWFSVGAFAVVLATLSGLTFIAQQPNL